MRIDVGAEQGGYTDSRGHLWGPDAFFRGGTIFHFTEPHSIAGTRDPKLYQSRREGAFSYDIPLKPGTYELWLHFAETFYGEGNLAGGAESSRVFRVTANGKVIGDLIDVLCDAGSNAADIRVFRDISPSSDGKLHLQFDGVNNGALLNGLEIFPGTKGQTLPIRMIARDHALTDSQGNLWEPEYLVRGGNVVPRHDKITDAPDPDLFRTERFGNLTYTIPVATNSTYTVRLHFAETWLRAAWSCWRGCGESPLRHLDQRCSGAAALRRVQRSRRRSPGDCFDH